MAVQNMINRGYSATPTASLIASWDANSNLSGNNFLPGYATTATAGGTTTLLVGSAYQQFFTGTLNQTLQMPVTSTLVLGQSWFVTNSSSGVLTVTSSGGNTILAMAANTSALITCVLTSGTTDASWYGSYLGGTGTGTVNVGSQYQIAYYAANGNTISGLTGANGGVLVTDNAGAPSMLANPGADNRVFLSVNGDASAWSAYSIAAPGAVGNVQTSDGTNWVSSPPASVANASISNILYLMGG